MINVIPKPNRYNELGTIIKFSNFKIMISEKYKQATEVFTNELLNKLIVDKQAKPYQFIFKFYKNKTKGSYKLKMDEHQTVVVAGDEVGFFYATRTLSQLFALNTVNKAKQLSSNGYQIIDKPAFQFRSFLLDEVRHFFGKEEVKKIIDLLSLLKYNYFHWHLADDQGFRINFKEFPKLKEVASSRKRTLLHNDYGDIYDETQYQYCYELEDILEVIAYAKKRYISIIPELDVPGHTTALCAAYPHLHCFNKQVDVFERAAGSYDIICPGKETTYQFINQLYKLFIELFSESEYIHIGGDEVSHTNWEKCPDCKRMLEEKGLKDFNELQGYFSNQIVEEVKRYNKKIIMWHDGIKNNTDPDVILEYFSWKMESDAIDKINQGRQSIYAPCLQTYFDSSYAELPLNKTYGRHIVLDGLNKDGKNSIFGMECCEWTEFIRDKEFLEFMIVPRLEAFSESSWTLKKNYDYSNFKERLVEHLNTLNYLGFNYASLDLVDPTSNLEEISKEFRNTNRFVEYVKNKK